MGSIATLVALGWAVALVARAKTVHRHFGFLRRLYIPSSVLAGFVALLVGPQVLGALSASLGQTLAWGQYVI